jgi:hypothetical protein
MQLILSGHKLEELFPCIQWLAPFAKITQSLPVKPIKQFDKIPADNAHNIQIHNNGMQLLVRFDIYTFKNALISAKYCNILDVPLNFF